MAMSAARKVKNGGAFGAVEGLSAFGAVESRRSKVESPVSLKRNGRKRRKRRKVRQPVAISKATK